MGSSDQAGKLSYSGSDFRKTLMNHCLFGCVVILRTYVEPANILLKCSDEELLTRVRQGRRDAFTVLVRRYEWELYGYLRRYLGDGTLAEDVFQNTFLQVFVKIASYEPGRPVRPWLYTIATNQAIDAMRRNGRHQAVSLNQGREDKTPADPDDLVSSLECKTVSPLDAAQGEERRLAVRAAVDKLPDFLRQVVLLGYYQGLKYREIADILDIPLGTVKSRLHTALAKLQEAWATLPSLNGDVM
jgi:RNA polymerase sigma-70 factor (ECF subfamily)